MLKSFSSPSNIYKCNFLSSYTCRNLRIRCMMLDYNFSGTLQLLFNCSENAEVFPIFKNTFLYFSSSNAAYLNSYKCNSLYKPIRPQLFRSLFFRFFFWGGGGRRNGIYWYFFHRSGPKYKFKLESLFSESSTPVQGGSVRI